MVRADVLLATALLRLQLLEIRRRTTEGMTGLLALAAAGAALGAAIVAVSSRDPRTASIGLLATLLGLVFVADPLPPPPALAVRLVAGILAGYLLWVVVRGAETATSGSALAWPTESSLALAGAVIGWASHGLGAAGRGPEVASGLGFGLLVLSAAPVVLGRSDVFRTGVGLSLLFAGASSMRVGLAGVPGPVEQVVLAGLTAGLGAAIALLVRSGLQARTSRGDEGEPALQEVLTERGHDAPGCTDDGGERDAAPAARRRGQDRSPS